MSEQDLDSIEVGDAERLGRGEVVDGQGTVNDIGVVGPSARGGVGACKRKEGAVGPWDGAVQTSVGGEMGLSVVVWSCSIAMTTSWMSPNPFTISNSGAPTGGRVVYRSMPLRPRRDCEGEYTGIATTFAAMASERNAKNESHVQALQD